MTEHEFFDPLMALSYAHTALDDPHAVPDAEFAPGPSALDWREREQYAVEKIDAVMNSLAVHDGTEDLYGDTRHALVTLGRLIADVQSEIPIVEAPELVETIGYALDTIDAAIAGIPDLPPGPK